MRGVPILVEGVMVGRVQGAGARRWDLGRAVPFGVAAVGVIALAVSLTAGRAERGWADASVSAAAGSPVCVAASAHAGGSGGTNWRTDLEVHSVGPATASFTIQCLVRGQANPSPTTRSYSLAAGRSRRFDDVLLGEFGIGSGAAALVVTASSGQILVTSRTYNLLGSGNALGLPSGSTFGQFVPGQEELEAVGPGQQGRLIQLSHSRSTSSGYRSNLGLVNATSGSITVHVALYRGDGALLGSFDVPLGAREYTQLDRVFERVTGGDVAGGYAVLWADGASPRFFAYASVVDNRTGDPVLVPAIVRSAGGAAPTPTRTPTQPGPTPTRTPTRPAPTPTRTPTQPAGASVNLSPYQPSGWSGAVVPASETGTTTAGYLSSWYDTYVDWAVVNWGPDDIPGRIDFELRLDGQRVTGWYTEGLQAGYYVSLEDYRIPSGTIAAGWHSLSIVADPANVVAESNEGDNEAGGSFEWTNVVFSAEPARAHAAGAGSPPVVIRAIPGSGGISSAAATRVLVPASAHAGGTGGTNWRTDLEVHNPGSTTVTFTVELLRRGEDNAWPSSQSFNLAPGRSVRYDDVLWSMFGFSGAAALRVTSSSEVLVTSRTYNLLGSGNALGLPAGSTFGQFVAGVPESAAIGSGEQGRLIQLSHSRSTSSGYRTNLGLVNAGSGPIHLEVALYRADGASLGTVPVDVPPGGYTQLDKVFERVTGSDVGDGYAVVWTTTSGGRFLAYASVVDNRTGDPVFVPALKVVAGSSPPTPTRTPTVVGPTPTPTGEDPLSISIIVGYVMGIFGSGDPGEEFLPGLVNGLIEGGVDGMIDDLVEGQPPEVVTRLSDGVRLNYGSGYTLENGTVLAGSVEVRVSKTVETASRIVATVSTTTQNFSSDGEPIQVSSFSVAVDVNRRTDGTVYGTVSPSVAGNRSGLPWSVSGNLQVDTAVCVRYPIGGTLLGVLDGRTGTATFSPSCDGTYAYTADGLGYYSFDHRVRACDGTTYGYRNKIALMAETGTLVVEPSCAGEQGMGRHFVVGSYSASGATLRFNSDYATGSIRVTGTFTSTSVQQSAIPGQPLYYGRVEYTVTEFNYDGSEKCERTWVDEEVMLRPSLLSFCGYI